MSEVNLTQLLGISVVQIFDSDVHNVHNHRDVYQPTLVFHNWMRLNMEV